MGQATCAWKWIAKENLGENGGLWEGEEGIEASGSKAGARGGWGLCAACVASLIRGLLFHLGRPELVPVGREREKTNKQKNKGEGTIEQERKWGDGWLDSQNLESSWMGQINVHGQHWPWKEWGTPISQVKQATESLQKRSGQSRESSSPTWKSVWNVK